MKITETHFWIVVSAFLLFCYIKGLCDNVNSKKPLKKNDN
jgi:hypothetical protein